ncbi:MAG: hypothetical protein M5R40_21840 [Anaerolineae bacterium]|nr:hypothetical protein [Anaerolineae bacterium]
MKHRWFKANAHCYRIVGFVDGDVEKRGLYVEDCCVLGSWADIPALVDQHRVDLVVLALEDATGPTFRRVLSFCERTTARIRWYPTRSRL